MLFRRSDKLDGGELVPEMSVSILICSCYSAGTFIPSLLESRDDIANKSTLSTMLARPRGVLMPKNTWTPSGLIAMKL